MIAKTKKSRLVLFDAHAIVHRAYHALPDFATKAGEPTGGLYGLSTMLLKAIADFDPDYMAACYDLPGPTFRHKEYKEYKAGRKKADDELKHQLQRSRDIFTAFNIPIYDAPGFEADDMLGTIVEQTKKQKDLEVIIVSGDMDTLQLVSGKKVRVYTLRKGLSDTVIYDEEKVEERFGFGPSLLPDYKGLRGDPSDNIIGIAGIGEKTGGELIRKFGSLEQIYKTLKKKKESLIEAGIKSRIVELLEKGEEEAMFSKMLATIRRDGPVKYALPERIWKESFDPATAEKFFRELEFKSLAVRVKHLTGTSVENKEESKEKQSTQKSEPKATGETLSELFSKEEIDPRELREAAIALWVLDSEKTTPGIEDILEYTGESDFTKAKNFLLAELKRTGLEKIYREIELPLIPIIERAQSKGILVDVTYLKKLSTDYHKKLSAIESAIYEHAGEVFNINSPKQLGVILFDKLELTAKGLRKTEGGARSTRESELEKLRDAHPIIGCILEHRELQKLLSTYIDNIPLMVDGENRVHTTLHQDGAATGRFSSSNPGMQNIPVREGLGSVIRDAFIAPKGKLLLALDYSQVEMRVLAMLSGDPGLSEIFTSGADIHTSVASRVFRVDSGGVTKEMRRRAKVINFGIIYGMGVNALKDNLGSTREEAQEFYDQYFITFPRIAEYFERVKKEAAKKGYTETLFGRRRQFPNLKSSLPFMKAMAERMAMNAPLQGTAADFIKIAMNRADMALNKEKLGDRVELLLQVHDELIYEVDPGALGEAVAVIKEAMEGVAKGTAGEHIPLVVDAKKGERWGSLSPL
jgi:DNA polymerase-1